MISEMIALKKVNVIQSKDNLCVIERGLLSFNCDDNRLYFVHTEKLHFSEISRNTQDLGSRIRVRIYSCSQIRVLLMLYRIRRILQVIPPKQTLEKD